MKASNYIIKSHKFIIMLALCLLPQVMSAQKNTISDKQPILLLSGHERTVSFVQQPVMIDVLSNVDFEVSTDANWINATNNDGKLEVSVENNLTAQQRMGTLTVMNKEYGLSASMSIVQEREQLAASLAEKSVKIVRATDNTHQSGADITKSYDGDVTTMYHSLWNTAISEARPAILDYYFNNEHIDYIAYIPRQNAGNGCFGKFKLYYKLKDDTDYRFYGDFDFKNSGKTSTIKLTDKGMDNVACIRFVVSSGVGDFASCAEMLFRNYIEITEDYDVFADDIFTTLKPNVNQERINKIENVLVRHLAQQIYDKEYDTAYRTGKYECLLDPAILAEQWTTGKKYDIIQGVTGIMITPGTCCVFASGIPANVSVSLNVYGWTVPEGKGYNSASYALHNGVNIINHTADWNGLAYISYYSNKPENYGDIKVHFVNGIQNGYLANNKSNAEMDSILANAAYTTIDVVGDRVHSVWETAALQKYTKNKYRRYINVLDTLIAWEHRLIGFEKYGRVPKNKTIAYVNYDYYMYQGGLGVTFKYDTQNRCCNPDNIMRNDDDVVWGLSHEWGHQHQLTPYFCWAGMSEVTNNMNSCYNVLHMGYPGKRISNGWTAAKNDFFGNDPKAGTTSSQRSEAYNARNTFSWNSKMQAVFAAMSDNKIKKSDEDPLHALAITEVDVEETLAPFFMLHCYFTQNGFPDFTPDIYEALRNTDFDDNKYAMVASSQNAVSGRYAALAETYPNSCWVTDGYVSASSSRWQNSVPYIMNYIMKASKTCGYNLLPYFDSWGFLRQVALTIDDYGTKYYCMTKEMYNEFKTDMDKLVADGELKTMPEGMIEDISLAEIPHFPVPDIPN